MNDGDYVLCCGRHVVIGTQIYGLYRIFYLDIDRSGDRMIVRTALVDKSKITECDQSSIKKGSELELVRKYILDEELYFKLLVSALRYQ